MGNNKPKKPTKEGQLNAKKGREFALQKERYFANPLIKERGR